MPLFFSLDCRYAGRAQPPGGAQVIAGAAGTLKNALNSAIKRRIEH